jgi:predicted HicB family RNase H-like nuclease
MAPASKAHINATKRWEDKAYDKFLVRVPKGRKEAIQSHAAARGESLNGYVTKAVDERMERDKAADK